LLDANDQLAVVRGLREGSQDAWARLYDGYSLEVWRYVSRLLGPNAAAVGDVVQDAFLAAAGSARQFDPERGTLWSWLAGIAHHGVTAYWRQESQAAAIHKILETKTAEVRHWLETSEPADALCEQREVADLVRSVLAELSADYAALLAAKYLDERSLADLAPEFGLSQEALKSKLARARREFRAKFANFTRGDLVRESSAKNPAPSTRD
jgi:RNA polymerase sigma-70 factor, ECF subfamily